MKVDRYIYTVLMTALLIGWGCMMTSCSSDSDDEEQQDDFALRVASVTRTGGEEELAPNPLPWGDIHLSMISKPNENPVYPLSPNQSGTVRYNGKDDAGDIIWVADKLIVKPGKDYYIFGYMPDDDDIVSSNTIKVTSETAATMNLNGLPTVSNQDVCIVVGVKEGKQSMSKTDQGSFIYHAPESTAGGYYVSLLADHLYAAMEVRITIDEEYNDLRTIKLKQMVLKNKQDGKLNATISLVMNDEGNSPISTIGYAVSDATETQMVLYENEEGKSLVVNESDENVIIISGYFAEGYAANLSMVCTYDIYDKSNNKLDSRTTVNSLTSTLSNLKRGQKKIIHLKVNPTYLYILSNDDVDK